MAASDHSPAGRSERSSLEIVSESSESKPVVESRAPLSRGELRGVLGNFATGVTIITAGGQRGERLGITANSFSSVSLEPPLVLFSLDKGAYSLRAFLSTAHFAVSVLSTRQRDLATRFAVPMGDKWATTEWRQTPNGSPWFPDSLAVFDCSTHYTYQGGDHVIFVGQVDSVVHYAPRAEPLLYFRGRYAELRPMEEETP